MYGRNYLVIVIKVTGWDPVIYIQLDSLHDTTGVSGRIKQQLRAITSTIAFFEEHRVFS